MNSQFSYELDERQIKILMLNGESHYDDALWNRFELIQESDKKLKTPFTPSIPKINFEISRSIIIPIVFVILIGGLSALLFSFVDFKKKPNTQQPETYQLVNTTSPLSKKSVVNTQNIQNNDKVNRALPPATSSITVAKILPQTILTKEKQTSDSASVEKPSQTSLIQKEEHKLKKQPKEKKKKKRKKMTSEELPSINSTIQLVEPTNEPELDLK